MALYGVLKSTTNTGADSELSSVFSTPLSVTSKENYTSAETLSLRRIVSASVAQRWEIEAELSPTVDTAEHLVQSVLNGAGQTFCVRMPQPVRKVPVSSGNPVLAASAAANDSQLNISGGVVGVGDFIQVGVHTADSNNRKVYLVTKSVGGLIDIFPPLSASKTINTAVVINEKVTMYGFYEGNSIAGMKYSDGVMMSPGTVKIIEALR